MNALSPHVSDIQLRDILVPPCRVAIVGAKDNVGQPVDRVGRYLLEAGFTVFPVHPVRRRVWGLEAWPSLETLPEPVDIVNLFRAAKYCTEHAQEVLRMSSRPRAFWMQQGIRNADVRTIFYETESNNPTLQPMLIIEDRCIKTEHQRICCGN